MDTVNKTRLLEQAQELFTQKKYERALLTFARVLEVFPLSKEAKIGAILTEMAMNGEIGAQALFDYYTVLKATEDEKAEDVIEGLIETVESGENLLKKVLEEPVHEMLQYEKGVMYEDFKQIVEERSDFKRTFEDVMFSTKVIITKEDDFTDFLENLIDYKFYDMSYNYLESALNMYPNNPKIVSLLKKLDKCVKLENTNS